ncbi:hypothetical protein C3Y87_05500 [Carbonactinospora thermoautotrophica]|uniref:hypothetical protein n=1 Tax=Carbonactinospora thermoautotrophica TaxID=1469144 RepID=UPI002271F0A5|nr:hypothetical protein [Carbonactinospora thermoautotrophica]MCX9190876.1 hypothetical protein [Carbonactinospora thermoautotrophica]
METPTLAESTETRREAVLARLRIALSESGAGELQYLMHADTDPAAGGDCIKFAPLSLERVEVLIAALYGKRHR